MDKASEKLRVNPRKPRIATSRRLRVGVAERDVAWRGVQLQARAGAGCRAPQPVAQRPTATAFVAIAEALETHFPEVMAPAKTLS